MPTIDAATGQLLSGLPEVFQSIGIIFATPKGSRLMRRLFGANRRNLQDKGISPHNLIDFYAEVADALSAEPRFKLTTVALSKDSDIVNGQALFDLAGIYYPRGHLGDFSIAETVKGTLVWSDPDPQSA